jgi:hypothetical protein
MAEIYVLTSGRRADEVIANKHLRHVWRAGWKRCLKSFMLPAMVASFVFGMLCGELLILYVQVAL